jgi:hypothetical protein
VIDLKKQTDPEPAKKRGEGSPCQPLLYSQLRPPPLPWFVLPALQSFKGEGNFPLFSKMAPLALLSFPLSSLALLSPYRQSLYSHAVERIVLKEANGF